MEKRIFLLVLLILKPAWRELDACLTKLPPRRPRPITNPKPFEAACEHLDEVPAFVQNFTKRLIPSVPDCNVSKYNDLFENIRYNFLKDKTPSTVEELYFMVMADFSAAKRRALRQGTEIKVEVLNELRDELVTFKKQVVDQIENYRYKMGMDGQSFTDRIEKSSLYNQLEKNGIPCRAILEMDKLLNIVHIEFETTPISCQDEVKLAAFQLAKRRFLLQGENLKVKDVSRNYFKMGSQNTENQFGKNILDTFITNSNEHDNGGDADFIIKNGRIFINIFRVMLELVKDLELLRRSVGEELRRRQ